MSEDLKPILARIADEAATAAMESLNENGVETPDRAVDNLRDYIADAIAMEMR